MKKGNAIALLPTAYFCVSIWDLDFIRICDEDP